MDQLYLEGCCVDQGVSIPASSLSALFVLNFCECDKYKVIFVERKPCKTSSSVVLLRNLDEPSHTFIEQEDSPDVIKQCCLPAIKVNRQNKVISGLSSVVRHVVRKARQFSGDQTLQNLLGHKDQCLKACAEVSAWTKFCEVEMPNAVDGFLTDESACPLVPPELHKLENQFLEPVVVANMAKRRRDAEKTKSLKDAEMESLKHNYVEGLDLTLADIVLYPLVLYLLAIMPDVMLCSAERAFPHVLKWCDRLGKMSAIRTVTRICHLPELASVVPQKMSPAGEGEGPLPIIAALENLHIRQAKKKKFKSTSAELSTAMDKLKNITLSNLGDSHPSELIVLPWDEFSEVVHPKDGDLPTDRLLRKCQQLENLAQAVVHVAKPGHTVVDFCSGGGHLGILLAYLLPQCQIILVENKEESIQKAEKRIDKLALTNITIYQCNLDYFVGRFDIGTCLHACGVATDLVLQSCIDNRAAFVVCPCCYGGIQNTHTVTYPRSQLVRNSGITYHDYLCIGHGADQTQFSIPTAQQGKRCMIHIDIDRAALAQEHGYTVTLTTLQPAECSPKNNLLIGTLQ